MPTRTNKTILDTARDYLGKNNEISAFYDSRDYFKYGNVGNILYINDFFVFPRIKLREIDELNSLYTRVRNELNLDGNMVKDENFEFKKFEDRLLIARLWYEEIVGIDEKSFRHTRKFNDLSLIPEGYQFVDGSKDTIIMLDESANNPFKDNSIKRRVRMFFYPDETLAKLASENLLNPFNSIDIKYLKK